MEQNDEIETYYLDNEVSILKIKQILRNSKSIDDWKEEIKRICNGQRDGYLKHLGNIKIYIESELFPPLEEEKDRVKFDLTYKMFHEALEEVIEEWNPSIKREKEFFACILEFIQAYNPKNGFRKTQEFLEIWENRIDEIKVFEGYNSETDLIQESLFSFDKHFPTPRDESDKDFKVYESYLHILEKYLLIPKYSGYSAIRLLELNEYDLKDHIFGKVIKESPLMLEELCSNIFSPDEKLYLKSNLAKVGKHVLTANESAILFFPKVLALYDAKINYEQNNPVIELANNEKISIDLGESNFENYENLKNKIKTIEIKKEVEIIEMEWEYSSKENLVIMAKKAFAKEAGSYI